ncbi:hypothetical protein EW145_g657 [Phellinidium pouzarii]|uniref:HECT-like ubiquitin-conjugating enzyme-binding-domain-containing protein n=1 Tax=Phellinidium pouzarii TaxID=167371 RepID=A0A4S4LHF0_9AGAM|nr:hypothetical protein EW145_g657 [Phellinidium pouzarii]
MATLTQVRPVAMQAHMHSRVDSSVPTPFPIQTYQQAREQQELLDGLAREELDVDPFADQSEENLQNVEDTRFGPEDVQSSSELQEAEGTTLNELLPSLVYVQQSCLMTLNNLLSGIFLTSATWQPILPPRRHSMPSRPVDTAPSESSSALQILLTNLRNSGQGQMSEASSNSADDSVLIGELQRRVDSISQDLSSADARLARALISLLSHVNRLSSIDPTLSVSHIENSVSLDILMHRSHVDIYDELSRQVLDLQIKRLGQGAGFPCTVSPQRKVEVSLLWSEIDQELEAVSHFCRQQSEPVPRPYSPGQLPPDYDYDEHEEELLLPPKYEHAHHAYPEKEKRASLQYQHVQTSDAVNEKMRMDFEAVTMAIDRLYLVAPQLHNQRVELRKSKLEELERARLEGPFAARKEQRAVKGKERENDVRELEKIIDMVGRASNRRLNDQSVFLEGDMQSRIKRAKQRDVAKRDAFLEHLSAHSNTRRIASQDAVFQPTKTRSPDVLLTLPEFINEQISEELQQELEKDPNALLTLSEIVKEPPPAPTPRSSLSPESLKSNKLHFKSLTKRSRSLSAPPLSWLIPSLGRTTPPRSSPESSSVARPLTVRYVAEHHENLNHVLVFIGVDEGMVPGVDLEADVLHRIGDPTTGDKLVLKCGSSISTPLSLPMVVSAGKASIRVQGGHFEIKLPIATLAPSSRHSIPPCREADSEHVSQLLDAAEITELDPTSFICASCSSALVQHQLADPAEKLTYQDLPSEYWSELLEAWMCHQDQKLTDRVAQHSRGFWPKPGQAFVGGSYMLFDESAVVQSNMRILEANRQEDEWRRVQCICGAIVGRCQTHILNDETKSSVYRIPKYALRPVSLIAEPCRIPFSAFILEDMLELVRAHATYRFIIFDEEEEHPRLLIWLFKPSMRLSYATTAQFALPQTGSVYASKVLFKILPVASEGCSCPSVSSPLASPSYKNLDSVLQKYPGFPQAERLLYPRDVCQRLTSLLRESNTAYPMGVRVMTGLLTGWLRRT